MFIYLFILSRCEYKFGVRIRHHTV